MKIAFDAQLLFEKQKTGIGWTADYVIKNIIKECNNNEYYLNYFGLYKGKNKTRKIREYKELGYKVNKCSWFHNVVYRRMWNKIPIPYTFFFGKRSEITQFFNYDIPPGVKGKAITFVYDMVYRAFPHTINEQTMKMLDNNLIKACKRADHIITISQFSKNEIIKYLQVPGDKISIMPCGVDLSIFNPNYSDDEISAIRKKYCINKDYILYLGTLEPRKNIEILIEAYLLLKVKSSSLPKLVIAGKKGWMYESIFKKVELYNLKDDVIFTDYVDDGDVPILLNGASIFVFPSIYEGFGLPPLEAMACGTPVIASNTASIPEVIGDAGILVNPYSPEELSCAIEELINDEILRLELRRRSLQQAEKYTWKMSVHKLKGIYQSLLD